jgi:diguanylate cyclase (GGDEF)-like protein
MSSALPESETVVPFLVGTIWDELVSGLRVGVLLQNTTGHVLAANNRAAELLGIAKADLLNGIRPRGWSVCDDSGTPMPELAAILKQVRKAAIPATGPFVVSAEGMPNRRLWAEIYPVSLRGEQLLATVLHPVHTDLRRSKGLLDPLTGLPSRPLLFDRLEQALTRASTHGTMVSVILADLRGLGEVNATHGFRQGDQLLAAVGKRLREELRADHTVARYGGGTFAVLADHPHGTGAPVAERVRRIVEVRVALRGASVQPTLRTGWATSGGASTVHELIGLAELRLRNA